MRRRLFLGTLGRGGRALLAALLLAGAAGCDTVDDEDGTLPGTFHADVTGDLSGRHTGVALFATIRKDEVDVFGIQLQAAASDPYVLISLDRLSAEPPGVGTYTLFGAEEDVRDPTRSFVAVYTRSRQDPFLFDPFVATGGELTVTASGANRIEGRIAFTARGANGRTIRVEGAFDAIRGH